MSLFMPYFSGEIHLDSMPEDYFDRLEDRAAQGWLMQRNH